MDNTTKWLIRGAAAVVILTPITKFAFTCTDGSKFLGVGCSERRITCVGEALNNTVFSLDPSLGYAVEYVRECFSKPEMDWRKH